MTSERAFRFSVVTDDIMKSVELYANVLKLPMLPLSNAIAMFPLDPLGVVQFEVCHREAARDLLEHDFGAERPSGVVISRKFEHAAPMNETAEAAIGAGLAELTGRTSSESWNLRDFNGVNWFFSLK